MSARESPNERPNSTDAETDTSQEGSESTDDSDYPLTRRQAIVGGGGIIALLAAGLGVSHVLRPARAVQPTVPEDDLERNGWVQSDLTAETVLDDAAGPINVEAIAATVQYENEGLTNDIKDTEVTIEYRGQTMTDPLSDYLGSEFDQSMGVFAATKIDLTPHIDELPGGLGRAEVMDPVVTQAQEQFDQQLRDAGLEDVRQVEESTLEVDTGQEATLFEYRASFTFEETNASLQGTTITIPGDEIEVAGYLAVWHNGRNVLIAAGAHPNENYTNTVTDTVQGAELTISFDLELSPSSLRDEVQGYMARVE